MQSEMSGLEPYLISYFPGVEVASGSGCHEFSGRVVGGECFILSLVKSG